MDSSLCSVSKVLTPSSLITEHEIYLTDPSQLDDFESWCQEKKHRQNRPSIHLRLAQRLFGPPRISLSWKQRCHLFQLLSSNQLPNLTTITFHGTTMGQVISAELLSTGIPSSLCTLTMDAGLIFDQPSSVQKLANSLHQHAHLQQLQLYNFLNHVRPIQVPPTWLLDPLLYALGTCPNLTTVELACLASFLEWKVPLLSSQAIQFILTHTPHLKRLQWTNLGLTDSEFSTMAETIPQLSSLQQVIVNGNENTIVGLRRLILQCLSLGSTITHLEVMNHVKLTEDLYDYVLWYTEQYSCPLQWFEVTFPLRIDPTLLRLQLRFHQLQLAQRYYSPLASTTIKLQVLGQVSNDPNCLFRLLQQQPNLLSERLTPRKKVPRTTTTTECNSNNNSNKNNKNNNHHNINKNHHDNTNSLWSRDDDDNNNNGTTPARVFQTKTPHARDSETMWIFPATGRSSTSIGLLTVLLVFFSLIPAAGPSSQDFHGLALLT